MQPEDIWILRSKVGTITSWTLTWPTIPIAPIVKSMLVRYLRPKTSFPLGFLPERRITNRMVDGRTEINADPNDRLFTGLRHSGKDGVGLLKIRCGLHQQGPRQSTQHTSEDPWSLYAGRYEERGRDSGIGPSSPRRPESAGQARSSIRNGTIRVQVGSARSARGHGKRRERSC